MNLSLSLGVTLNIWDNDLTGNKWEQKLYTWGSRISLGGESYLFGGFKNEQYSFEDINANLGMMWEIESITLGAVLKTPFEADLTREYSSLSLQAGDHSRPVSQPFDSEKLTLDMPMCYGIGIFRRMHSLRRCLQNRMG